MLAPAKFDVILNFMTPCLFEGNKFPPGAFSQEDFIFQAPPETYVVKNHVAILPVHGTACVPWCVA